MNLTAILAIAAGLGILVLGWYMLGRKSAGVSRAKREAAVSRKQAEIAAQPRPRDAPGVADHIEEDGL